MAKIAKSAETGKIVSKKFAKDNPKTTFETVVKPKSKAKTGEFVVEVPLTSYMPMLGEKFELNGVIAEVVSFEPLQVIEHAVINGCQTQSQLHVDNLFGAVHLDPKEAFRRLS